MSRCLRIFTLYSFRLTRKHSTLLLIISFLVILTMILQLYAYRRHDQSHPLPKVGDFDYKPGAFLKGRQPNETTSYCDFNYGLPDTLQWNSFQLHPSPESEKDSPFKVIYNAIKGRAYANYSHFDAVSYVTQATPEFLYHIVEIARYWDGPISLAVFVPDFDLDVTMQIMNQLCHCYSGMSKVSLHLFFPNRYPPKLRTLQDKLDVTTITPPTSTAATNSAIDRMLRKKLENYRNLNNITRAKYIQWVRQSKMERMMRKLSKLEYEVPNLRFNDCSGLDSFSIGTYRKVSSMLYPINVGRNVARKASTTNYFLVSDIEMVPSDYLAPRFLNMIKKLMKHHKYDENCVFAKTVFVVPLFEVAKGEEIPRDKETLVRLVNEKRAMYFHQKVCVHCQRFPGLQTWLIRPAKDVVEPMLISKREYPYHRWEPLYFGTNKDPWYSEMLSWEGRQDKMTQMLELCLQRYRLVILDGGFLCHAAATKSSKHDLSAERANSKMYRKIVKHLRQHYGNKTGCMLSWGLN